MIQRPSWASNLILAGFLNAQDIISSQDNFLGLVCYLAQGDSEESLWRQTLSFQPGFCLPSIRFLQHAPYEDASSTSDEKPIPMDVMSWFYPL